MKYMVRSEIVEAVVFNGAAILPEEFSSIKFVEDLYGNLYVDTPDGPLECEHGDYIIKYSDGTFYPCQVDIFEETYIKI